MVRQYIDTHEWVALDAGTATVGVSDFAQAQLGDVVWLELPLVGVHLNAGDSFGVIESVKAANDLYSPITGVVTAVNEALVANPELVNRDPLGEGWLIRLTPEGEPPPGLLDEETYRRRTEGEH